MASLPLVLWLVSRSDVGNKELVWICCFPIVLCFSCWCLDVWSVVSSGKIITIKPGQVHKYFNPHLHKFSSMWWLLLPVLYWSSCCLLCVLLVVFFFVVVWAALIWICNFYYLDNVCASHTWMFLDEGSHSGLWVCQPGPSICHLLLSPCQPKCLHARSPLCQHVQAWRPLLSSMSWNSVAILPIVGE